MKKNIGFFFTIILLLASCAPARVAESTVTVPPSIEPTSTSEPAFTATVPPATLTMPPTVTATHTPVPCDPFTADFCITDGSFLLQRPVQPPANVSVDRTYPYASTADGTRDPHHGVEIQGKLGTPVHAAADGTVIFAGPDREASYNPYNPYYDFYGNLVVIEHDDGLYTLYAHLSKVNVQAGDEVKAGDQIGEMGQSGAATGSHLHFEVRWGDADDYFSAVNPELRLSPSQAEFGAIAFSIVNGDGGFQQTSITIQRMDEFNNAVEAYYVDAYHPSLAIGDENAAIGDLPAGQYRLTLIANGRFYERRVEVESGKLTQVVFVVE
jgi:hypothetical protein